MRTGYPVTGHEIIIFLESVGVDKAVSQPYTIPLLATDKNLRTFLLDKDNKIVAIGNPMENPSVKKFYLKILTGKEQEKSAIQTKVEISTQELDLGTFPKEEQREILFKNVGDKPLRQFGIIKLSKKLVI